MNPRLLKSYLYWKSKGVEGLIVAFRMGGWTNKLDDQLIEEYQLNICTIPATKSAWLFWLKASLINKIASRLSPPLRSNKYIAYASSKRSWQLKQILKKINKEYNYIEGHTLGALYPAYYLSKKWKTPFIFDVEDYHPGEKIQLDPLREKWRRELLMLSLLPQANLITAASPLIAKATEGLVGKKAMVINNSFYEREFIFPSSVSATKLKLVWFSQNISYGRGLEKFIQIAHQFSDALTLTLIGNLNKNFENEFIMPYSDLIRVVKPMSQESLHRFLSEFDIGLALEDVNADYNRNICLTNKIWAYFQAGLYILATNTQAQQYFLKSHPQHGMLFKMEDMPLQQSLKSLINQKEVIRAEKRERFEKAKPFAYEYEMKQMEQFYL
jgi:hypothetical protein